ncbi:peptide deformylase [Candidatus Microgenomates bacterium]|nr:peptide deformylase [Candidatus Microgenomates bacterium]
MAVQKILSVQNPLLRRKSKSVITFDRKVERLIADLSDTLKVQKDPVGVGLAAPQVGKDFRLFIIKSGKNVTPFINPEIVWKSEETNDPRSSLHSSGQATRGKKRSEQFTLSPDENRDEPEYIMEGCLSLPHYYGPVQRATKIKVRYQTLTTQQPSNLITKTQTFSGLPAQIIQHEVDHLNGILFVDRLLEQGRKLYQWKDSEWTEVELP